MARPTLITAQEAAALIPDGARIMVGGFMGCGNAHKIVEAIAERGTRDLTLICNDAARPDFGVGKLVDGRQLSQLIASHVGLNPVVAQQMNDGLQVELVPQGTLVERIRAGGAGLGGVLTKTGLGTLVADGKPVVEVDGQEYLLEKPLRADVAILNGFLIDHFGNIWYKGTTRNFNYVMATAADLVIAEADHYVPVGRIPPEDIVTPGVLVNHIVDGRHP